MMTSAPARRFLGLRQGLHLTDDFTARVADAADEWGWVAERQHHRRWFRVECHIQGRRILLQRPKDETNADPRVASLGQFPPDSTSVGIARPYQAEAASIGDGRSQTAPCGRPHRRQQYRMLDAEQSCQRGFNHGHGNPFSHCPNEGHDCPLRYGTTTSLRKRTGSGT